MKTFKRFINEANVYDKPDYSFYTKELNVDEFFELYKKNCKEFDWRPEG